MRHPLLLLLFTLLSYCMQAQFATNDSKWGITFSPAIVSSPTPAFGFQPGAEYRLSDRFYVLGEMAFPIASFYRDSFSRKSFFRIKSEIRYMFEAGQRRRRGIRSFFVNAMDFTNYIGLQASYSHRHFRDVNGGQHYFDRSTDTVAIAFDNATIKSHVFTTSLQWGAIYVLDDNFYIDVFMGVGVRIISTQYTNVTNPRVEPHKRGIHNFFPHAYMYPWTVTRPHLTGGIRLIYRFD